MSRLTIPARDDVPEASKPVLDAVEKQLGVVPNMFRLVGSSPATLQGFVANNAALGKPLDLKTRERIALAVAQANACNYCLSAHTYLVLNLAKISLEEIELNRKGASGDDKANVAVRFAAEIVRERGHVADADIKAVRDAGFSDGHIVEIIAVVAENIFTNLLNVVPETDIDFPSRPGDERGLRRSTGWQTERGLPARLPRRSIMSYGFLDIAMTPSVRAAQASMGSEPMWQNFEGRREFDRFTPDEAAFIAARDSFYMASVSETGWPYVQHRGGPPGFLRVLDERTLGFADYRGNRQYISLGNLLANDRVALILMDYPNRSRMKIYAHVEPRDLNTDAELVTRLAAPGYKGKAERGYVLYLESFDWNCPQHIVRRFTEGEIEISVRPMRIRMEELETENAILRARLATVERK